MALALKIENEIKMEIWDNPHPPAFKFQQYRAADETKILPYEALAILKNADGSQLANAAYFDQLRDMTPEWQIAVDRFLVPLAIQCAAEKKRLPVAVNVHLASLFDEIFMKAIDLVIDKSGLQKNQVMFEIVEPHVPNEEQIAKLTDISSRTTENGFALIIDDHDFDSGHERLRLLAPFCDMVKIDLVQAAEGFQLLRTNYPHLSIVLERVTFNDREDVFAKYPGVFAQGI